jgi:hypothetical protein
MSVVIHDRALAAIDVLEPWERDQLMEVVDAFSAGMEAGSALPLGVLERGGVFWLLVSIDLRAVLRPVEGSPGQFILVDIVRPETLRNIFPDGAGRSVAEGGVA